MNILFVCLGNICRSVTAEEVFRTLARRAGVGDQFTVDSAGMIDYHEGELADSRMRACAQRRGYTLTHRSRPVRKEDFSRFDLIVAMDDNNVRQLHNAAPSEEAKQKVVRMADYLTEHSHTFIPDPYYDGPEAFNLVVTLLEDACAELLRRVEQHEYDPTLMSEEEFFQKINEAEEAYNNGKYTTLNPGESVSDMLKRCGYDV